MSERREEHGSIRQVVDKVQDLIGGVAGRIGAATVTTEDSFIEHAAIADLYELKAAKLALRRSGSDEIKTAARTIIDDHITLTHHLRAAIEMNETRATGAPPSKLDTRRRKMYEHLEAAPDDRFDTVYLDQQVLAHEEAVALMHGYRDRGDNAQLRSVAASAAPVVERHLERVKAMRGAMAH